MADLWNGRLLRLVVLFTIAYIAATLLFAAPTLIRLGNGIAISIASGVCVAYSSVLFGAALAARPTRGELLGAGIFFVSLSILGMRCLSVIARDLGWPSIYNTNWMSGVIAAGILGGILHLWAPNAADGRIPKLRWLSTSALIAIGLLIAFLAWIAHGTFAPVPTVVELR